MILLYISITEGIGKGREDCRCGRNGLDAEEIVSGGRDLGIPLLPPLSTLHPSLRLFHPFLSDCPPYLSSYYVSIHLLYDTFTLEKNG
jgi:hypothetical protein